MLDNIVKQIHTSCQDCCFAIYENNTQIDCSLALLDLYRNKQTEILGAYNNEKENSEFFIINNRKCYFKRNKEWADSFNFDPMSESAVDKVFDETKITYMAIIIADNNIEDIELTIKCILALKIQPSFIVVIRKYGSTIDINALNSLLGGTGKKWRVSTPSTQEITPDFIIGGLCDLFCQKYPIYLVMNAGNILFRDVMYSINNLVIYDDFKFGLISINDGGKIGNSSIHKFLRGEFTEEYIKEIEYD